MIGTISFPSLAMDQGRKYPCNECEYQASKISHLNVHQQSVHQGRKYPCQECEYQSTTKSNLTAHHRSVHLGEIYPCQQATKVVTLSIKIQFTMGQDILV